MKRYEAFYKDDSRNNHMIIDGHKATEVRYDIIASSEVRALELIKSKGDNPNDYNLEETTGVKDQRGRYFSERIRDARI